MSDGIQSSGPRDADRPPGARGHSNLVAAARVQHELADRGAAAGDAPTHPASAPTFVLPADDLLTGYQILREISRGSQGAVYQALQKSTSRTVAIKVLRDGPFAGAADRFRFEREVQVLAQLKHPNIVAIHDSGAAGGCHYFVMDYIDGRPLNAHMAGETRSIDDTLRLFAKICAGVNAAHLRGVIHRDLKPGNISIDPAGEPHILDFGLAKVQPTADAGTSPAFDGEGRGVGVERGSLTAAPPVMTMTGQFVGSLPWAAPEQAAGAPSQIDVRTDVYALGVILYQMLTGQFPYEVVGNLRDVLDRIMHAEPLRPRTLRREIGDEVETIVLKCLSKERERRYQSAGELLRDVERYLRREAIEAKRDSAYYVLRKSLRRHRLPVGFAAVLCCVLVAAAVSLYISAAAQGRERRRADREAEAAQRKAAQAEQQRRNADAVAQFMASTFEGVKVSHALGRDTLMLREMLDAAATRIENGELEYAPEAELRLRWTIGEVFNDIGAPQRAWRALSPTIELARRTCGADSVEEASSLKSVAHCLHLLGKHAEALPLYEAALQTRRRHLGDGPETAACLSGAGWCLEFTGRPEEARRNLEAALEIYQQAHPGDHPAVAGALNDVAYNLEWLNRFDEALARYEEALEMCQRLHPGDHPDVALNLYCCGDALRRLGRAAEALNRYEASLQMRERLGVNDHPDMANGLGAIAVCLQQLKRPAEALPYVERALQMDRRLLPPEHANLRTGELNLGSILTELARYQEAEIVLLDCYQSLRASGQTLLVTRLTRRTLESIVRLYDSWCDAVPDGGYDERAAAWRARLNEWEATTQPAAEGS